MQINYSRKAKDHFKHPRNVGTLDNPDAVGEVGSLACGQMLRLMLKLDREGRIAAARFQAFGCVGAIAACSALTEMLHGRTLDEAKGLVKNDITCYLEGLPEQREFCSDIAIEALHLAIQECRPDPVGKAALETEPAGQVLDCRGLACPLNYVKTKIQLDQMLPGDTLCVLLDSEGARNVPISVREEGHEIVEVSPQGNHWRVILRK